MTKKALSNNQKKDLARMLFLQGDMSQKAIAHKVGATEKTIGRWKESENWEVMKTSLLSSKKEEIAFLYRQLSGLRERFDDIEQTGKKTLLTSKEADAILKITAAIRNLEVEAGLGEVIEVAQKFLRWLSREDLAKAQEITPLLDQFIQENIS